MAFTNTISTSVTGGTVPVSTTNNFSGDGLEGRQISITDSTPDQLVTIAVDVSAIQSVYMVSDQALTVETNNSGAPDETIVLTANNPYIWWVGSYFTNLLATDITALYLTNASGSTAQFDLQIIFDSTP